MLEEYCKGLKLCYDCKMGNFAHKSPSKFECRFKMLHTGPAWKKDPRTKSGTAGSKARSKARSKASSKASCKASSKASSKAVQS